MIGLASGGVGGWVGAHVGCCHPVAVGAPAAENSPPAQALRHGVAPAPAPSTEVSARPATKEPDLHDLALLMRPCGLPDAAGAADLDKCRRDRLRKLADAALADPGRPIVRDQVQLWRAEATSFTQRLDGVRRDWLALENQRDAAVAAEAARRVAAGESLHHVGDDVARALEAARAELRVQEATLGFGRLDRTLLADQVEARVPQQADTLAAARAVLDLAVAGAP